MNIKRFRTYEELLEMIKRDFKQYSRKYPNIDQKENVIISVGSILGELENYPEGFAFLKLVQDILDKKTLNERVYLSGGCTLEEVAYVVLRNKLQKDVSEYFKITLYEDDYKFCGVPTQIEDNDSKTKKVKPKRRSKKNENK